MSPHVKSFKLCSSCRARQRLRKSSVKLHTTDNGEAIPGTSKLGKINMKKRYLVLIILFLLLIWYGEKRKFYEVSTGNWITIWKTYGGRCFLIPGKYYGVWPPSNDVLEIKTGTDLTLFFSSELPQVVGYRTPKKVRVKNSNSSKIQFYHYEEDPTRFDSLFYFTADSPGKKVRNTTEMMVIYSADDVVIDKNGNKLK